MYQVSATCELSDMTSTSFPLPLGNNVEEAEGDACDGRVPAFAPFWGGPASCHAGIEGLLGIIGVDIPLEVGPRLKSNAFSDLSS